MNQRGRGHCHSLAFGQPERPKITAAAEAPPCFLARQWSCPYWTTRNKLSRTYQIIVLFPESAKSASPNQNKKVLFFKPGSIQCLAISRLGGYLGLLGGISPENHPGLSFSPSLPQRPAVWGPLRPLFGDQPWPPSRASPAPPGKRRAAKFDKSLPTTLWRIPSKLLAAIQLFVCARVCVERDIYLYI